MPSQEKIERVAALTETIKGKSVVYLLNYQGLKVPTDNQMRRGLKKDGVTYLVEKNTLVKIALNNCGMNGMDDFLLKDTSVAIGNDVVDVVKKMNDYSKKQNGLPSGKAVYFGGMVYSGVDLDKIAKLPSKNELLSQVVRGINTPITSLVFSLSGVLKKLVYAVNAVAEKKQSES